MFGTLNSPVLWIGFTAVVVTLLVLDLVVFHRGAHVIKPRESATWVGIWVSLALIFAVGMFIFAGPERGTEFITGYLIEWTLSVDNLFVFLIIFTYFAVPNEYRYNVLFWGILAAIILRGAFILVGAALLATFHWMIFVFGGFLIYTGIRILLKGDEDTDPERNLAVRVFRKIPAEHCQLSRRELYRKDRRPLAGDASLARAARRKRHRRGFRLGFRTGDLRHHA